MRLIYFWPIHDCRTLGCQLWPSRSKSVFPTYNVLPQNMGTTFAASITTGFRLIWVVDGTVENATCISELLTGTNLRMSP